MDGSEMPTRHFNNFRSFESPQDYAELDDLLRKMDSVAQLRVVYWSYGDNLDPG